MVDTMSLERGSLGSAADYVRRLVRNSFAGRLKAKRMIGRIAQQELRAGEVETRIVPALCQPGKGMVDVGANHGVYTYLAQPHAEWVIAAEANPKLADFVNRWAGGKVRVVSSAISDERGSATLHVPLVNQVEWDGFGSLIAHERTDVPMSQIRVSKVRLDDLQLDSVGFVKVDVEGHEVEVVRGAKALIVRDRPNLLIEAEERHRAGSLDHLRAFFSSLNYRVFFLLDGRLAPIEEFAVATHQDPASLVDGAGRKGLYVNNFIFVPEEREADIRHQVSLLL